MTKQAHSKKQQPNIPSPRSIRPHPLLFTILFLFQLCLVPHPTHATTNDDFLNIQAHSALLMEQSTGTILYEKNAHTPMAPASVTKIMTILLVMESLAEGTHTREEQVTISANAAGMGGSQVYLKENETMSLWELLKCVVVVSGNDASVALAEYIAGSETLFVQKMNQRAKELGMVNTLFFNCTGLPQAGHTTTAYDIALMSQELMKNHPEIQELTTIWMDTIREGDFGLSNTNRLIFDYNGATGLKTGSTDSALYCMSATASRDGTDFIAVILKAPTSSQRFTDAKTLLDYGFSNFYLEEIYSSTPIPPINVLLGTQSYIQPICDQPHTLLRNKSNPQTITTEITLPSTVEAPIAKGQQLGTLDIYADDSLIIQIPISTSETVTRMNLWDIFHYLFSSLVMADSD